MTTELLDSIQSPADLRRLDRRELKRLAEELRGFVLESVSKTGGHLSSNLGTVELTLALHQVFDTPHDRIVWDVGHQSYPHKILTGRRAGMAAAPAGRHLRLSQAQRIGIRRLRHRALVHLDLGRPGHGGGLAQRRRAAPAHRRDRRRRDVRRHGVRGHEQRRRHAQYQPAGDPERQRHVDLAAGGGVEPLFRAADVGPLLRRRQERRPRRAAARAAGAGTGTPLRGTRQGHGHAGHAVRGIRLQLRGPDRRSRPGRAGARCRT